MVDKPVGIDSMRDSPLSTDSALTRRSIRLSTLLLAIILLLALGLSCYCYSGFFGSDDGGYLYGIRGVAQGELVRPGLGASRLGVTAPAALVYRLTSGSITATIASFLLYAPLLSLVAYLIGKRLHDVATGLVAAFLVAACPLIYLYAGAILPDNPMAFWSAVSLLMIVVAVMEGHKDCFSPCKQVLLFLLAGLCLGCAYMVKESALILVVPFSLGMLFARRRISFVYLVAFGVCFVMGVTLAMAMEALSLKYLTGEWMFRFGISQSEGIVKQFQERTSWQGATVATRLHYLWGELKPLFGGGAIVSLLAVVIHPWLRSRRPGEKKAALIVLACFCWTGLYLTFGSASLRSYQFPSIQPRYYAPCIVPLGVVAACVLVRTIGWLFSNRKLGLVGTVCVICLTVSLPVTWAVRQFVAVQDQSADIFRAPETKAFLTALKDVHNLYPDVPVVLSQYLSTQMQHIVPPGYLPTFQVTPRGDEYQAGQLPPPPFILLAPAYPGYVKQDATLRNLRKAESEKLITLKPVGLGYYAAPLGRINEIREYLFPLSSCVVLPQVERTERRRAVNTFLVTKRTFSTGVASKSAR